MRTLDLSKAFDSLHIFLFLSYSLNLEYRTELLVLEKTKQFFIFFLGGGVLVSDELKYSVKGNSSIEKIRQ